MSNDIIGLSPVGKSALMKSFHFWYSSKNVGSKYLNFSMLAADDYGLKLHINLRGAVEKADIIDEQKFIMFMLTWA